MHFQTLDGYNSNYLKYISEFIMQFISLTYFIFYLYVLLFYKYPYFAIT